MLRAFAILALFVLTSSGYAQEYKYAFGVRGEMVTLSGGDLPKFTLREGFGASLSCRFARLWTLNFDLSNYRLYNDVTAGSSLALGGDKANATQAWKATRLGIVVNRDVFSLKEWAHVSLGLGGGLMIWKFVDPQSDTTLKASGALNQTVDYSASEIFLTVASSITLPLTRHLSFKLGFGADHLTTAGAEFQAGVNSARPRWLVGSSLSLILGLGQSDHKGGWKSDKTWASTPQETHQTSEKKVDSDGDGVPDAVDRSLATPKGAAVDNAGYPLDTDGDGVDDERDDCPHTEPRARNTVDIFGCPVDSDFDGIPDYLDVCPFNQIGAHVDTTGCPVDSDADGIPDGLDDCPNTLYGVTVDRYGCIDLSIFSQPLVLHIDYAPGSFELDPVNREKLKDLARILDFVPAIKLDINGYTDNIGQERANRQLSEKRARRVYDHLAALGVAADRMKVFGHGETGFVASNDTADGRAENRRVEIVFYR
jgi:outer membrane protein OmpA-like peptidoglycan-associated protein